MFKKKINNTILTFVIVLLSAFAMFSLSSCDNGEKEQKDNLAEHERIFFDTFKNEMLPEYYDPSSVKIISVETSYMDASLVRFTTTSKNKLGGNARQEFFFTAKEISNATEYYEEAGYDDLTDGTLFAQSFKKGIYCDVNSIEDMTTLILEKDKIGLVFYYLKNYPVLYDKLEDTLTYNVANLNSALNDYKAEQGW